MEGPAAAVSDQKLLAELRSLVRRSDLATATTKSIRRKLEEILGTDLKSQKDFIKKHVESTVVAMRQEEAAAAVEEEGSEVEEETVPKPKKRKAGAGGASAPAESTVVSAEMLAFLGETDESLPFSEVRTRVMAYMRDNLVKDEKKKKFYILDDALIELLGVKKCQLFGVAKYLKRHFKRWVDVVEEPPAPPPKKAKPAAKAKPATKAKPAAKTASSSGAKKTSSAKSNEGKPKKAGGFATVPFQLSSELQAVTGQAALPRPQVVKKIWEYIRAHNLQNPEKRSEIQCDAALKAVMGQDVVTMFNMNKFIGKHMTKLE
uniref:DM2 domain-containing protein n=1 Tax=Rhizochromulina marina TaxID=1034831 RepID=A0A7S2SGR3_9STRA|mmetsp:Transcript_29965/g.87261  ORF Transcript_29965/g.87261 Transcript_29965/m.87261 type:complete len:318 (+) Transcript_29965:22-975(+)